MDAGYTSTDYVTNLLKNKRECRFLSITNGDNVYGSEVVANVLSYAADKTTRTPPDMLLAPLDSRNFAEHGTQRAIVFSHLIGIVILLFVVFSI